MKPSGNGGRPQTEINVTGAIPAGLSWSFCAIFLPDGVNQSPLFRDRAVSTLLKIEIEMAGGLLGVAGSEMANQDSGLREVGVESRRQ
jgi:hypothetical protein